MTDFNEKVTEYKRVTAENIVKMANIYEALASGQVSEEDAIQQMLVVNTDSTLNNLDFLRSMTDDLATAYAVGDFNVVESILPMFHSVTQALTTSLLMQIRQKEEWGLDGLGGV